MVSLFILICPQRDCLTAVLLPTNRNAFICKKQKSTPKKRIFRVPYAVNSTPYIVKLEFLGNKRAVGLTSFYSRVGG